MTQAPTGYALTGKTCPNCGLPLHYSNAERVVYCGGYGHGGECDWERPYSAGETYPDPAPTNLTTPADAVRAARGSSLPPSTPIRFGP